MILLQGHGKMGVWDIDCPSLIRFGQLTMDELFVTEQAARAGVVISNLHDRPHRLLKHFGPGTRIWCYRERDHTAPREAGPAQVTRFPGRAGGLHSRHEKRVYGYGPASPSRRMPQRSGMPYKSQGH